MELNKKGISLIVLVITVIVMIIIAATAILLVNNDGIKDKSKEAVEKNNLASLKEEVGLKIAFIDWEREKLTDEEIESELESIKGAKVEKIASDAWTVEKSGACVTVYKSGKIIKGRVDGWDGTSKPVKLKEGNWYIYTCEELKFLADFVNNGNKLTDSQKTQVTEAGYDTESYVLNTDTTVYLMNDLDLGARHETGVLTKGNSWEPIGNGTNLFNAIFEGNNHYIEGLYIKRTGNFTGIFGKATNRISNLTVKNGYIEVEGSAVGGIVGVGTEVINCHNINTTIKQAKISTVGGIAGQVASKVEKCTNSGKITTTDTYQVGGIVGMLLASAKIENCSNTGAITCINGYLDSYNNIASNAGGVIGATNGVTNITNCKNEGKVVAGGDRVGGIVGIDRGGSIENCINNGQITGKRNYVGGVAGIAVNDTQIINTGNNGNISGEQSYVGGINGNFGTNSSTREKITIHDSYNTGTIKMLSNPEITVARDTLGGIVGCISIYSTVDIQNVYNTGNIIIEASKAQGISGIIGYATETGVNGTIRNSYTVGKIDKKGNTVSLVGGIVGRLVNNVITISNSYYLDQSVITQVNGEGKTESDMKTAEFVTLLNTGLTSPIWEIRAGENNNYPVFKK